MPSWNRLERSASRWLSAAVLSVAVGLPGVAAAQVPTFAGNAQHTSNYTAPAQDINAIRWSVSIDENLTTAFVHYGSPLVTASNTVITGIKLPVTPSRCAPSTARPAR